VREAKCIITRIFISRLSILRTVCQFDECITRYLPAYLVQNIQNRVNALLTSVSTAYSRPMLLPMPNRICNVNILHGCGSTIVFDTGNKLVITKTVKHITRETRMHDETTMTFAIRRHKIHYIAHNLSELPHYLSNI